MIDINNFSREDINLAFVIDGATENIDWKTDLNPNALGYLVNGNAVDRETYYMIMGMWLLLARQGKK